MSQLANPSGQTFFVPPHSPTLAKSIYILECFPAYIPLHHAHTFLNIVGLKQMRKNTGQSTNILWVDTCTPNRYVKTMTNHQSREQSLSQLASRTDGTTLEPLNLGPIICLCSYPIDAFEGSGAIHLGWPKTLWSRLSVTSSTTKLRHCV